MPTPRPEMSVVVSAVEKPGVNSSSTAALHVDLARPPRRRSARPPAALRATRAGSIPRPSSRTSITTLEPAWRAEICSVPVAGLPAATRSVGGLQAVVQGVAHEVHERIAERVDDGAVKLGVGAPAAPA